MPTPSTPVFRLPEPAAVIVMGVSGCGKTTVGKLLADALGCGFLEGDSFHSADAVARMAAGQPLTDEDRWPWLDRVGAAVRDALQADGVAVAACSALKRSYRERLIAEIGPATRFVLLDVPEDKLRDRVAHRPLHYMPASLLASQLETLERPGADEPALMIEADRPAEALSAEALRWLSAVA